MIQSPGRGGEREPQEKGLLRNRGSRFRGYPPVIHYNSFGPKGARINIVRQICEGAE